MKPKKDRKALYMSLFIAFIMVFSVIGFMWDRNSGEYTQRYKGYVFTKINDEWVTRVNGRDVNFQFSPDAVESIKLDKAVVERINATLEVDVTYDINNSYKEYIALAEQELAYKLNDNLNIYLRGGFTAENEYDFPVITCANATAAVPVLYFTRSNETAIYLDNGCIIAASNSGMGYVMIKDRILYGVFGIIG